MKNLLRELILPSFWFFFFIVSSNGVAKVDQLKKSNNTEVKKPVITASGETNIKDKNKR